MRCGTGSGARLSGNLHNPLQAIRASVLYENFLTTTLNEPFITASVLEARGHADIARPTVGTTNVSPGAGMQRLTRVKGIDSFQSLDIASGQQNSSQAGQTASSSLDNCTLLGDVRSVLTLFLPTCVATLQFPGFVILILHVTTIEMLSQPPNRRALEIIVRGTH